MSIKEWEVGEKRVQRKEGETDDLSGVRYDSKNFQGTVLFNFPNHLGRWLLFFPILQMRKLRCRKVKWLVQSKTARKFWRQDSNLSLADFKVPSPMTSTLLERQRRAGTQEGGEWLRGTLPSGWGELAVGGSVSPPKEVLCYNGFRKIATWWPADLLC